MMLDLAKTKDFFLDIVFPRFCLGCGKGDQWLCEACSALLVVRERVCPRCFSSLGESGACQVCKKGEAPLCVISACNYTNPIAETLVQALKYGGIQEVAPVMAQKLVHALRRQMPDMPFQVTAVPLHEKRFAERGYNQAEVLARLVAEIADFRFATLLFRKKDTPSQVRLSRIEREVNLDGAFLVQEECLIEKNAVLLIDDVVTTGSTMRAAAKCLVQAGVPLVIGLTFAHG